MAKWRESLQWNDASQPRRFDDHESSVELKNQSMIQDVRIYPHNVWCYDHELNFDYAPDFMLHGKM